MKILNYLLLYLAIMFGINYVFNHINPWVAIILLIAIIYLTILKLKK
jgi:hypothetical protein